MVERLEPEKLICERGGSLPSVGFVWGQHRTAAIISIISTIWIGKKTVTAESFDNRGAKGWGACDCRKIILMQPCDP